MNLFSPVSDSEIYTSGRGYEICSLPVVVVLRKRVWYVWARHQQEGADQMNYTATGQEDERGTQRHSVLIQQLRNKGNITTFIHLPFTTTLIVKIPVLAYITLHYTLLMVFFFTLTTRKTAEEESKAPLYRVMMVERCVPKRFPTCSVAYVKAHVR